MEHYVDVTELYLHRSPLPVVVGDTLVYSDETHVTAAYARLLAPVIGLLADRALARS